MKSCFGGEPGSDGFVPGDVKARRLGPRREPDSAVLALLWGSPVRVLLVRKSCRGGGYWACDAALPGGSIEGGEGVVEAALREAWDCLLYTS
ncbi:MAG: NUDIX hydrolase, partial [Desulfurococcales archaeon]|nr:NUDIX hydrolase [Desulfurococcales archaeon]